MPSASMDRRCDVPCPPTLRPKRLRRRSQIRLSPVAVLRQVEIRRAVSTHLKSLLLVDPACDSPPIVQPSHRLDAGASVKEHGQRADHRR